MFQHRHGDDEVGFGGHWVRGTLYASIYGKARRSYLARFEEEPGRRLRLPKPGPKAKGRDFCNPLGERRIRYAVPGI